MTAKKYFKSIGMVIVSLIFILVSCDCKNIEEYVSINEANNKSECKEENPTNTVIIGETTNIKQLNLNTFNCFGISGEYLYYMSEINYNSDICDYEIMRYNLQTDKKEKIGEIAKLSAWSNVVAFVNSDRLYATFGAVENEQPCNKHVQIDLKSGGVTVLSKDSYFPPLVQNISVNENCFVEYQPQQLEDGSYRYVVRVVDIKNGNPNDVIVKERKSDYSGEMIVDATVYDDMIYTCEYDAQTAYVCSYDIEGNQVSKESIEFINEFLNTPDAITGDTETMWSIDVINGYYFFESLNGNRLVLHKTDKGWTKRKDLIMNRVGSISNLVDDFNPRQSNYTKVVLYDYNTQELSYLDTETGEKVNLSLELPGATYCMTDGKQLVYMNDKQELYYIADVFAK